MKPQPKRKICPIFYKSYMFSNGYKGCCVLTFILHLAEPETMLKVILGSAVVSFTDKKTKQQKDYNRTIRQIK